MKKNQYNCKVDAILQSHVCSNWQPMASLYAVDTSAIQGLKVLPDPGLACSATSQSPPPVNELWALLGLLVSCATPV